MDIQKSDLYSEVALAKNLRSLALNCPFYLEFPLLKGNTSFFLTNIKQIHETSQSNKFYSLIKIQNIHKLRNPF